jgi:nucleotide-binding universal stress UspA family protein
VNVNTVIYANDLSVCCQNAGVYATFFARSFSAELLVAHAFSLSQAAMEVEIDSDLISEQRKDLEFLLARKAEHIRGQGIAADSILLEGDPKKVLPALADQKAPCLLVLGTHGGGWIERELIGSVAEHVLRSTSSPVVTVGPQVKSKPQNFHRILYATDSTPEADRAASYAEWFAAVFGANVDLLHAARKGHQQILQQIQDDSVDLLMLGVKKASHFGVQDRNSSTFRLIVDAICPVLTIVS